MYEVMVNFHEKQSHVNQNRFKINIGSSGHFSLLLLHTCFDLAVSEEPHIDYIIYYIGFFITDLHEQLSILHSQSVSTLKPLMTVYRGQVISIDELNNIKTNIDGFISMNTFFSTTLDCSLAFTLSGEGSQLNENKVSVVYMIDIDTTITTMPFYNIKDLSYFQAEDEILFSIDTIFKLISVEEHCNNDVRVWLFELKLIDKIDNDELDGLYKYFKDQFSGETTSYGILASILYEMGESEKAEKYSRILLEQLPPDDPGIGVIYSNLGTLYAKKNMLTDAFKMFDKAIDFYSSTNLIHYSNKEHFLSIAYTNIASAHLDNGNYTEALKTYEKALDMQTKILPSIHAHLVNTYNNIASVYSEMGNFHQSLKYYQLASDLCQQGALPHNHPTVAVIYNNLGFIFDKLGNRSKAMENFEIALEIRKKCLASSDHRAFSSSYTNIGTYYLDDGNYAKAKEYLDLVWELDSKYLPVNHPEFATTCNNFGLLYEQQHDYTLAFEYYQKSVDILTKTSSLPPQHPLIAVANKNLARAYRHQKNYERAMEQISIALDIEHSLNPINLSTLSDTLYEFSCIKLEMNDCDTALKSFQQALDLSHKCYDSKKHRKISKLNKEIGITLINCGQYEEALKYYQQALQIELDVLPKDHFEIGRTYNNIGAVLSKLKKALKH
ncbi:unnamed protein product [Didymodactylos carnosus]|uniref:Uncharacterized protein n=1 Tax=Didymodactylos carnosus TaxID=1234261 RepID=A0A815HKC0_9BILA|nr:unnamed protein product [Didymodactylos carnosus]CAF4225249.1 unnamed protein product [Didymodactylos carnosus]